MIEPIFSVLGSSLRHVCFPNGNNCSSFSPVAHNLIFILATGKGVFLNSTPGMASYVQPPKKGASSYVSRYAAIRDTIGLPHIDLIGSTSQIHSLNGRTERYIPTRHTIVSRLESERYQPPRKRSLASVATPEKV